MPRKLKERHQRWLAEERGTVRKDWGGKLRIALAFPNRYAVGMSNLGFQSVHEALNRNEQVVCERVFHPEPEDLPILRQPPGRLLSVESQRPVADFHLLAFSISFENDFSNAVEMIRLGGLPLLSEQRRPGHPYVAAGGIAAFMNPEPLAPFMDFMFAGEGEALIPDFLAFWLQPRRHEIPRRELLQALAREVQGIYVPALYGISYHGDGTLAAVEPLAGSGAPARIACRHADFTTGVPCRTSILTPHTEFSEVVLLEIGRGCGRGCRFCAAGFMYRPVRHRQAAALEKAISLGFPEFPRVGLVSAAVSDHPEIISLCRALLDSGRQLSFSSLRADGITPELVAALKASGHRSVAMAVEAGSKRLRGVINKHLTLEEVYDAATILTEGGILSLKLYFMIGLPTETREDLEAIVEVAKGVKDRVLRISRGQKRLGTITLSINAFIPKPFTPFQWAGFAGIRELKERARWVRKALGKLPNVHVRFDVPKWAYVQAVLARGDRRVARFLEKLVLDDLNWPQALRSIPLDPDFWVLRERGRDEVFPWEVIDIGVTRSFLWEEYQRGLEGRSTEPCRPETDCRRCGACH